MFAGARNLSESEKETLGGEAGDGDQGGYRPRGPAASPGSSSAASTRGPSAPAEGGRASGYADDPAPECGRLEAVDGRRSHGPPRVRGGGEGRAALASVGSEPEETAWSEPDGPGAADGCECASRGPLGGGRIDADWPEPGDPGGFAEGEEARGKGVARTPGQGDRVTGLSLSKA